MIQRIQTVWLALAAVCLGGLFLSPAQFFAIGITDGESQKTELMIDHLLVKIAFGIAAAIAVTAIFLFKNRNLQVMAVKFGLFSLLMGFVFGGLGSYSYFEEARKLDANAKFLFGPAIALPILAFIFLLLALRAIRKDEKLVKSMDRLR